MKLTDHARSHFLYGLMLLVGVVTCVALGVGLFQLSVGVAFLLAFNVNALFLMGFDKGLAGSGALRVPEVLLFVIALLGGVPGIVLGTHVFRHKLRKPGFQFVLLLIGMAQVAIMSFLGIEFR